MLTVAPGSAPASASCKYVEVPSNFNGSEAVAFPKMTPPAFVMRIMSPPPPSSRITQAALLEPRVQKE